MLLVGRYVPTKVILVLNKDKSWFNGQFSHALGLLQEALLRWTHGRFWVNWEEFVSCQVRAHETYWDAKRQFSDADVLMNAQSPHKW